MSRLFEDFFRDRMRQQRQAEIEKKERAFQKWRASGYADAAAYLEFNRHRILADDIQRRIREG